MAMCRVNSLTVNRVSQVVNATLQETTLVQACTNIVFLKSKEHLSENVILFCFRFGADHYVIDVTHHTVNILEHLIHNSLENLWGCDDAKRQPFTLQQTH